MPFVFQVVETAVDEPQNFHSPVINLNWTQVQESAVFQSCEEFSGLFSLGEVGQGKLYAVAFSFYFQSQQTHLTLHFTLEGK